MRRFATIVRGVWEYRRRRLIASPGSWRSHVRGRISPLNLFAVIAVHSLPALDSGTPTNLPVHLSV